jgi:drug/metabolite transporter (DMT)-like permease
LTSSAVTSSTVAGWRTAARRALTNAMLRSSMSRRSWMLLLCVAAVWGGSFMLTSIAIRDLSVPVVALLRTAMGALVLLPIALARGALAGLRGQLGPVFLLGVVQLAAPFLLLGYGQRSVPSGLAGILVSSTPLWTALLAVWIDHEERSRGRGLVGLAVGIIGVALLCGLELSGSLDTLLGAAMLLLGALSYALGGFLGKRRVRGMTTVGAITGAMLGGTVALAPLALASLPDRAPGLGPLAAAIALGSISGGLGWLMYYTVLAESGPAKSTVALYLVPAFAVIYGVVLLGERLTVAATAGLALVVTGSWLAASHGRQRPRPPRRTSPSVPHRSPASDKSPVTMNVTGQGRGTRSGST